MPPTHGTDDAPDPSDAASPEVSDSTLAPERSEFSQRLASFGLGETPDPLLTQADAHPKRRAR